MSDEKTFVLTAQCGGLRESWEPDRGDQLTSNRALRYKTLSEGTTNSLWISTDFTTPARPRLPVIIGGLRTYWQSWPSVRSAIS